MKTVKALNCIKDERGTALVITLLMLVLMTLLGFTTLRLSSTDVSIAGNQKTAIEAQYAAESGLSDAIKWLNDNKSTLTDMLPVDNTEKDWFHTVKGSVKFYNYSTYIRFKPDTGNLDNDIHGYTPVVLYDQDFNYSSKAPKTGGFPVLIVTSTATGPNGYNSIVEMELTRYYINLSEHVKGAVTCNGNVETNGNFWVSGNNYDENGGAYDASTGLPGIDAQGTVDIKGSSQTIGVPQGSVPSSTNPRIKSLANALGMTEDEGTQFLGSSAVTHFTGGAGPSVAQFAEGGAFYVELTAGQTWGNTLSGTGLLIVHNPYFVPESWRVSNDPTATGIYNTLDTVYYDAGLDPSSGNYDKFPKTITDSMGVTHVAGSAGYANFCKPAVMGNINAGSNFKGVIITDIINKFNGSTVINGAVITLDSLAADVSSMNGNCTLKYSSAAIDKFAAGGAINYKLSWKKKTGYEP